MVPPAFTTATWLAALLRRWVRKGYAPNVSLAEDGAAIPASPDAGEQLIAVVRADGGRVFALTDSRVVENGETLFRYAEVIRCHWITDDPDPMEAARLKRTHFHRIIVELAGGRRAVLEGIGQAVFPLLRFFGSVASGERRHAEPGRT
jgi:hypothetical protein